MKIPEGYKLLADAEAIHRQIGRMASEIIHDYQEPPLMIPLLRGGMMFGGMLAAEIARHENGWHPEVETMIVSTYESGQSAGQPRILRDLDPRAVVKDRHILVVDDVLDTGVTTKFIYEEMMGRGAISVALATLATKTVYRQWPKEAAYNCFTLPNVWLVGMGMDHADVAPEAYRWIDQIWQFEPAMEPLSLVHA